MVLKEVEKWGFWKKSGKQRLIGALGTNVSQAYCKEGGSTVLFNSYALINSRKAGGIRDIENNRHGVNITVLIPM